MTKALLVFALAWMALLTLAVLDLQTKVRDLEAIRVLEKN